jgi:hypothetical protein
MQDENQNEEIQVVYFVPICCYWHMPISVTEEAMRRSCSSRLSMSVFSIVQTQQLLSCSVQLASFCPDVDHSSWRQNQWEWGALVRFFAELSQVNTMLCFLSIIQEAHTSHLSTSPNHTSVTPHLGSPKVQMSFGSPAHE